MNSKYENIKEACQILGLYDSATMEFIKQRYKDLSKKWHPDKCHDTPEKCHEMMQKINAAYKTILDYCNNYKYSFRKEDIERNLSPEELWYDRFFNDPIWGNPK